MDSRIPCVLSGMIILSVLLHPAYTVAMTQDPGARGRLLVLALGIELALMTGPVFGCLIVFAHP